MPKGNDKDFEIISKGDHVILRTHIETERDQYKRWQTQGEWLSLDAPWARSGPEEASDHAGNKKESSIQEDEGPKIFAIIATVDNKPLGWVNRYSGKDRPSNWFVGINICEDDYLNRGFGTEALKLWVDYLFENSQYHKLCLDTWSFNPRMMRVAERAGFVSEGCQRSMQFWQGEWLDLIHFGILREEWERQK
jgi:RimJ/RimL family protein N-acetyltransferase